MTEQTLIVTEDDPYVGSEFAQCIIKQLKALDTYDTYEGWSDAKIIDPMILTKERKREIPIIGDPDEITMSRVKSYYNALATLIEAKTGIMAVPLINLSHEGFGRALVMVGRLVVVNKTLRDVHRFGFPSMEKMCTQAESAINEAVEMVEKYREVAEA